MTRHNPPAKKRRRPLADPRAKRKGKRPDTRNTPQVEVISDVDEQFCRLYLKNGLNATDAYRRTHPRAGAKTASVAGCRVLGKASVQAWLSGRLAPKGNEEAEELATADRVVKEIGRLALASRMPRDRHGQPLLQNWPADVLALVEGWKLDDDGNVSEIKLAPKSKGVDLAARYHRLIEERSVTVEANLDLGSMTVEQIRTKLEAVMAKMGRPNEGVEGA